MSAIASVSTRKQRIDQRILALAGFSLFVLLTLLTWMSVSMPAAGARSQATTLVQRPLIVLYDQFNNAGANATNSQNYESANDRLDDELADDFIVPPGVSWTINQVDVSGAYISGSGPASSVNVIFYTDGNSLPSTPVATQNNLAFTNGPSFNIPLAPVVLTPGHYWVSVVANMPYTPNGQWGWTDRTVTSNSPAAWRNPNDGFKSCIDWGSRGISCGFDPAAPDQVFRLQGSSGPVLTNTPGGFTPTSTRSNTPANSPTTTSTPTISNTRTSTAISTTTPTSISRTAFIHFSPAGPVTMTVGSKLTLDMLLNSGLDPEVFVTAQQSYMTFTYSVIQNVRVSDSGCVLTSTVTPDITTFNAVLQNETCNGPGQCTFRGQVVDPGSMAFASGALGQPPAQGDFRIAQVAFCAVAAGEAIIHWQFSPPNPVVIRDSQIIDAQSRYVSNPALYTDYVMHVVAPQLVGHVTWQGRPGQPNNLQRAPITLTLKSGATEVNYPSQTTDSSGFFTVSLGSLANGAYNWRVKGPKYLANVGSVTLTGSGTTNAEMGFMRGGDANNDNIVNTSDFTILKNTFGKSIGQPGYDDRADFTGDQAVNASDFTVLKTNFGMAGGPPVFRGEE